MFSRLVTLIKAFFNSIMGKMEDPAMMLEQTYEDLQSNLIQVRQAVAQAIATEKQLEQQLKKNQEQATTWQNRAALAVQQKNDDLARQALQRKQQYAQAAADLEQQLKSQRELTTNLRSKLQDLENEVQKAYTKKQVLIARDKAAQATVKAGEILSKTTASGAMSVMEKMEAKVSEREAKAAALNDMASDNLETKFKSYEGSMDIEAELAAMKGEAPPTTLIVEQKEPVLIEVQDAETIEAPKTKQAEAED